jgi:hypothetical protein
MKQLTRYVTMAAIGAGISLSAFSQQVDKIINVKETNRIISFLASDEMKGRKTFSPEIDKAADFIAAEFKKAGLQSMEKNGSYLQSFAMVSPKQKDATATVNGAAFDVKNVIFISTQPSLNINQGSGYKSVAINKGDDIGNLVSEYAAAKENMIVWIDTSFSKIFPRLTYFKRSLFKADNSVLLVLGNKADNYSFTVSQEVEEKKLANVVGYLPGKSKKDEYVIFSGHYDHIGIGKALNGDSIYNGANDDAAGTTAVILLAKYFKALNNNERSIIFAAFTAEEIGGYGSRYFSQQLDPAKVMAMSNIEMIGTDSKWGKNSAYITGYEKTDMGKILQENLKGTGFTFHPDPYTDQQLFYRSDNATLARLGVPAHTISTSKMDNEPHYHQASDHVSTLDLDNMAMIIKSIAISAKSIISGKDTPSRVNVSELK